MNDIGQSPETRQASLRLTEQSLREQRGELLRMMSELRGMHETLRGQKPDEMQRVKEENEELRRALAELVVQPRTADMPPVAETPDPAIFQELQELRGENEQLRRRLGEQQELIEEMGRAASSEAGEPRDLESYEAELNRFRQQLEVDRSKINAEWQQVRMRNEELDEATREMEMEFSRERAELARERTRLERLREEVRVEMERMQRESAMRESLVGVQKLRERLSQR